MSKFFRTPPRPKGGSPFRDVRYLKNAGSEATILAALSRARTDVTFQRELFGDPFPINFAQLKEWKPIPTVDLRTELLWLAYTIRYFSDKISSFLIQIGIYEQQFFRDDFGPAAATLRNIKEQFGTSLWLIRNEISLKEVSEGLESQKSYAAPIWNDASLDYDVRFFSYHYSVRSEQSVSHSRFAQLIAKALSDARRIDAKSIGADYTEFHFAFFSDRRFERFLPILVLEGNSAIIDRYLTFRRVIQLLLSSSPDQAITKSIKIALGIVGGSLKDPLLENLQNIVGNISDPHAQVSELWLDALDAYTLGDHGDSLEKSCQEIRNNPNHFPAYELAAKSAAHLGKDCDQLDLPKGARRILSALGSLTVADESSQSAQDLLWKYIIIHDDTAWACQAFEFFQREFNHFSRPQPKRYQIFSELNGSVQPTARLVNAYSLAGKKIASSQLTDRMKKSPAFKLAAAAVLSADQSELAARLKEASLPFKIVSRATADFLVERSCASEALPIYTSLTVGERGGELYFSLVGELKCMLALGQIANAVELTADRLLERPFCWAKLPLAAILDAALRSAKSGRRAPSMPLAIIHSFYSKYVSEALDPHMADACEDFLAENNCEDPSKLSVSDDSKARAKLIYFLSNVCIPTVLDSLPWSKGSVDVHNMRLGICQRLLELDVDRSNRERYETEIKGITRLLNTRKGLIAVDQSRIYVEVDGLRKLLVSSLKESYSRFAKFSGSEILMTAMARIAEELNRSQHLLGGRVDIVLPQDESLDLLVSIISEIRDQFAFHNEYGLNSSLSMGIRHGTLVGQIRPLFEAQHLITRKDTKKVYFPNHYWDHKIAFTSREQHELFLKRLEGFSREVDDYLNTINDSYIRIRTESKPNQEAFFDLSISPAMALEIRSRLAKDTPLERLIDIVLERMWVATDDSLARVRNFFNKNAKERFAGMLSSLREELSDLLPSANLAEIDASCANATIEVQHGMDRLGSWFTRSLASEVGEHDMSSVLNIAKQMIENVYRGVTLDVQADVATALIVRSRVVTPLCYVFYNLLDNCRKYGKRQYPEPDIVVRIKEEGDHLVISARNPVEPLEDTTKANADIDEIRQLVADSKLLGGGTLKKVGEEGRSGFQKIAKLLYYDIGSDFRIKMGYQYDSFEVEIYLYVDRIRA